MHRITGYTYLMSSEPRLYLYIFLFVYFRKPYINNIKYNCFINAHVYHCINISGIKTT